MKKKYIWRVQPAPTGKFKSFERRGWPEMRINNDSETMLAQIWSVDSESYRPSFRTATDLALKVLIYKFCINAETGKVERITLKSKVSFASITEAMEWAEKIHNNHPEWTDVTF